MIIKTIEGCCEFDNISTLQFYNDKNELVHQIDPTDLTAIYGAYRQMLLEEKEIK